VRVSFIVLNSDDKLKTFDAIENWCFVWIIRKAPCRFVVFNELLWRFGMFIEIRFHTRKMLHMNLVLLRVFIKRYYAPNSLVL
jgi:hypothetical protein